MNVWSTLGETLLFAKCWTEQKLYPTATVRHLCYCPFSYVTQHTFSWKSRDSSPVTRSKRRCAKKDGKGKSCVFRALPWKKSNYFHFPFLDFVGWAPFGGNIAASTGYRAAEKRSLYWLYYIEKSCPHKQRFLKFCVIHVHARFDRFICSLTYNTICGSHSLPSGPLSSSWSIKHQYSSLHW